MCVCVYVCVVVVVVVVVEFHDYRKNTGHYKGANPDAMSEKKKYGPFPPRGDVRPTKSECIVRLCNKEPTKKRDVPK